MYQLAVIDACFVAVAVDGAAAVATVNVDVCLLHVCHITPIKLNLKIMLYSYGKVYYLRSTKKHEYPRMHICLIPH